MSLRPLCVVFFVIASFLLISSCTLLSPVKSEPATKYVLSSLPDHIPKKRVQVGTMLVLPPETRPLYNTTQMAYTLLPYQVAYFAKNKWAETPSQMLQPLIVDALQRTHYFHAVMMPPYVGQYDYVLNTHILTLQQDYSRLPARIQLTVRAEISHVATNQLIAAREFSIQEPIWQKTPYAAVIAANRATANLLRQLISFTFNALPNTT